MSADGQGHTGAGGDVAERLHHIERMLDIMRAATSSPDLEMSLYAIVSAMRTLLPFDRAVVFLLDERRESLEVYEPEALDLDFERTGRLARSDVRVPLAGTVSAWVITHHASRCIDEAEDELARFPGSRSPHWSGMRSAIIAPLYVQGRAIGTLKVMSRDPGRFSSEMRLLIEQVAAAVGAAVHHGELYRRESALVEQLRETSRIKDELIAMVSHDLKSPLTAMLGYARLLRTGRFGQLTDGQRDVLDEFERSSRHMNALLDDLSDVARLGIRGIELRRVPLDVRKVIEESMHALRAQAQERQVEMALPQEEEGETSIVVAADPKRLRQIVSNLLTNAIKYNRVGGRVDVGVCCSGELARVDVRDTGSGIPSDRLETVFELHARLDGHKSIEGTGLGLTITRELVTLHGGRIWVESELGMGSCFSFTLPLAGPAQHAEAAP
ncbi:MAG: GAF domain-containing protein [Proteobacteria bacterium]|nr:GAF domain-containing protein [Pseudomonadota bacterium]